MVTIFNLLWAEHLIPAGLSTYMVGMLTPEMLKLTVITPTLLANRDFVLTMLVLMVIRSYCLQIDSVRSQSNRQRALTINRGRAPTTYMLRELRRGHEFTSGAPYAPSAPGAHRRKKLFLLM
ncbi:hypothetical protein BDZ91DRAFT_769046 [Kalaharituber pfeilii]|nr:hypothetical protein BDZ91DRAFT_769046 [Kalaharituber pfeilii]